MKKTVIAVGMLLALVLAGCGGGGEPTATPGAETDFSPIVSVTGELVPGKWATISAKTAGKVAEVFVEPGDWVDVGAPLVRLDTTDLELALHVAQQEVAAQQATLDHLLAGASAQVIARADRENAQQIAQAEVALRVKEKQLQQAQAQDPAQEVAAAQALVEQLQAQVAQVRAQNPEAEVRVAQVELERAKIALDDTQDEYNKALDRPWEDQEIRDAWAKRLEQAQLSYRAAQARLDGARSVQRAHTLSLSALEAQIAAAQARLEQAVEAQEAYDITLDILADEAETARLQLEDLSTWENPYRDQATDEEIAQVEARLDQARWAAAQIEQQIEDASVRAPLAGIVGLTDVRMGELVAPGQILVVLGDPGTLRVETTDLDEIDVVQVSLGQEAAVTFDALPDRVFTGTVTRISPMAEPGSGGVHYTAVIELEEVDPVLRWGMTAFVDIEVER